MASKVTGPLVLDGKPEHQAGDFRIVPYQPMGGAREMICCKAPAILLEGPAGTGKSRGVLTKVHLCALKYPGMRGLFLRQVRAKLGKSVLNTFERDVLCGRNIDASTADVENRASYSYPNGSKIVLGGMADTDEYMSSEWDMIAIFEATETEAKDWAKLGTRLDRARKMPYNQIICDCNPAEESHWLNQYAAAGKMVRILSRHDENPSITPEFMARLQALTGSMRDRYLLGKWVGDLSGDMVFDGGIISWLREQARSADLVHGVGLGDGSWVTSLDAA